MLFHRAAAIFERSSLPGRSAETHSSCQNQQGESFFTHSCHAKNVLKFPSDLGDLLRQNPELGPQGPVQPPTTNMQEFIFFFEKGIVTSRSVAYPDFCSLSQSLVSECIVQCRKGTKSERSLCARVFWTSCIGRSKKKVTGKLFCCTQCKSVH